MKTKLDRTYKRGEQFDRKITLKLNDAFVQNSEYWLAKNLQPNSSRKIKIIFPKDRHLAAFHIFKVINNKEEVLSPGGEIDSAMHILKNGE